MLDNRELFLIPVISSFDLYKDPRYKKLFGELNLADIKSDLNSFSKIRTGNQLTCYSTYC